MVICKTDLVAYAPTSESANSYICVFFKLNNMFVCFFFLQIVTKLYCSLLYFHIFAIVFLPNGASQLSVHPWWT